MEIEEESKTKLILTRPHYKIVKNEKQNDDQGKQGQSQLQPRVVQTLCRPIASSKEFFLPHDIYIELNQLDNDQGFQVYKQLFKQYRPLLSVTHLKNIKFMQIHLDQSHRGMQNFDLVIHQLNSLQDQYYHKIAQNLTFFKDTLSFIKQNTQNRRTPEVQQKNVKIFQNFLDVEVKSILEEQDPYGFYCYNVMQCVDDLSDASALYQGFNENFIKLMGSDLQSYYNLIIRQGFFDITNYDQRNDSCLEFMDIINTLFKTNFDLNSIMVNDKMRLMTLDGIRITSKIQPQLYFCFGEDDEHVFPGQKSILGYLYLIKFSIDEKEVQKILQQRQTNARPVNELFYEEPEQSFQHFQYNCSSQHFKDFLEKHNTNNPEQKDLIQLQIKTCKYKAI